MIKKQVIHALANKTGIDTNDVETIVDGLFQVIQQAMLEDEAVHFKGFGRFFNKKRNKKLARNLMDNTAMLIEAHYIPSFKPSKAFLEQVKTQVKIKTSEF